jgi:hypothetical protein
MSLSSSRRLQRSREHSGPAASAWEKPTAVSKSTNFGQKNGRLAKEFANRTLMSVRMPAEVNLVPKPLALMEAIVIYGGCSKTLPIRKSIFL